MSILIKGMEMPKDRPQLLWVYPNGKALTVQSDVDPWKELQAVPVPPHGRLIEESKVLDIVSEWCPDDDGSVGKVGDLREMLDEIEALPTILEAEEGE